MIELAVEERVVTAGCWYDYFEGGPPDSNPLGDHAMVEIHETRFRTYDYMPCWMSIDYGWAQRYLSTCWRCSMEVSMDDDLGLCVRCVDQLKRTQ